MIDILAIATIIILIVVIQDYMYSKNVFNKFKYQLEFSSNEAYEGDDVYLIETIENRKLLPIPWLRVSIHSSRWLDFAGSKSTISQDSRLVVSSFALKSYQKVTRRWKLKCLKRGVFTTEEVSLLSTDLLGKISITTSVHVGARLVVYPNIVDLDSLFIPMNYLQGETIVKRWIVDDPFIISGAREYTARDPMNRIHWSASAKEGKLMVKNNDFTAQLSMTIILNVQSIEFEYFDTIDKDTLEYGIKVAASLIDESLKTGAPVRFCSNGSIEKGSSLMILTNESAGREHVAELLGILAMLKLKRVNNFEDYLQSIYNEITNSNIILITSYLCDSIVKQINVLKSGANHVSVLLLNEVGADSLYEGLNTYTLRR